MHNIWQKFSFPPLKGLGFLLRVVRRFFGPSRGFLLAGAVGYNALLSIIPLFIVLLVGLSHFFDEQAVLTAVATEISLIIPGRQERITDVIAAFVENRDVVGGVGFLVMIFFSSIAFRILEDAFSVIFENHHDKSDRHFLVSALIPYLYIFFVGLSLGALTVLTGVLDAMDGRAFTIFGMAWEVTAVGPWLTRLLGFLGMILMFSSIYIVMPTARIQFRRAITGGMMAAVLWELTRTVLVWYFDNLSLVNVVYGSLGTGIIALLTMEIVAIIILLGAQTIAELERAERAGVPWWLDPTPPEEDDDHFVEAIHAIEE